MVIDNEFNFGIVYIFLGNVEKVYSFFGCYFQCILIVDVYYFVVINFYFVGMEDFVVEYFECVICFDEKIWLCICSDVIFCLFEQNLCFVKVLMMDFYKLLSNVVFFNQVYFVFYELIQGMVFKVVVDLLIEFKILFNLCIEVNESWVIFWFGEVFEM